MRLLIDTSVDSGFAVHGSAEQLWAGRWLRGVGPLPVSSVTVFERGYGFERVMASRGREEWAQRLEAYSRAVVEDGFYEVLAWDAASALVAASVLARAPFPPERVIRRSREGRKTDARRSWLLDVLIASQAAADGRAVLTRNVDDFAAIAGQIRAPFELHSLRFPEDAEAAFDA